MSEARDLAWEAELAASGDVRTRVRDALSEDGPSAAVDTHILAAAHRAVGAGPRTVKQGWLATWRVPLSAAAVLVLATSLSVLFYEEGAHRRALETGASLPAVPGVPAGARPESMALPEPRLPAEANQAPSDSAREPSASDEARLTIRPSARVREGGLTLKGVSKADHYAGAKPEVAPGPLATAPAVALEEAGGKALAESETPVATTRTEAAPSIAPPSAVPSKRVESAPSVREAPEALSAPRPAASVGADRDAAAEAARAQANASNQAAAPRRKLMDGASLATRRPAGPSTSSSDSGLNEIESLWRVGRRDEARAALARWRCEHPGASAPTDFPIPFDDDTRCDRVAPKDAFPADR